MNTLFEGQLGERIRISVFVVLILLGLLVAAEVLAAVMGLRYIGSGLAATNTIVVSGHGESLATPDVATFTFSVVSDKPTVIEAQKDATARANVLTEYLKTSGIDTKDIQTSDYSVQPQFDYLTQGCAPGIPCPPGRQTLKGYEVRQTTTVKVRDTAKAGDVLAGIGSRGATDVSGLTFTFDNPDAGQMAARDSAIQNAKSKAAELAKSLGVSLVRVVSFNESASGRPPIPEAYGAAVKTVDSVAAAPQISVGQNKVVDDVTITYEIR